MPVFLGKDNMRNFCKKYQIEADCLAVGVSGGADSLALVLRLQEELGAEGRKIVALTVDHRLREESAREAAYVAELMQKFGIEHHILVWEGAKPESSIEEAAREARYALLKEWCETNGIGVLAVAHHERDQAETFLMRLQRGSGVDGLCAMAPVSRLDNLLLIRPFLNKAPEDMKNYLNQKGIAWVEDPSNQSDDFLRVKVRKFIPELEERLGLSVHRIAETTAVLQRTRNYLEEQCAVFIKKHVRSWAGIACSFSLNALSELHEEMVFRVLTRLLREVGRRRYMPRAEDVERLCKNLLGDKFDSLYFEEKTVSPFKGCTLGGCEIFLSQGKVWIVPELKNKEVLSRKDWEAYTEIFPQYKKMKLPYKLRLSLVKLTPIL